MSDSEPTKLVWDQKEFRLLPLSMAISRYPQDLVKFLDSLGLMAPVAKIVCVGNDRMIVFYMREEVENND